jgi:catechol 2,3-dioxygenase
MNEQSIDPNTRCGTVAFVVADLPTSLRYYQERIGLRVHRQEDGLAWLGAGGEDLLHLIEQPGARPVQRGRTGLYHFAILTPSRAELAKALHHLLRTETPIDGASDHGVSEALYLSDPDGHGIEIYRDRPKREWPVHGADLQMTTNPLDARGLLAAARNGDDGWEGLPPATIIGHVHLHVSDLAAAENFYVNLLGLDLMQRFGGQASFVSAGGYHHHLGLNTWAGVGAPPPPDTAARLAWFELVLPDGEALEKVTARLQAAGLGGPAHGGVWRIPDPAGNLAVLRSAQAQ